MIARSGPKVSTLPPLRLYREDCEKLLAIFKEHCQQVTFGDEEHVYESLDEMEQRTHSRLRCFAMTGIGPNAELVLRGSYSVPLGGQRSTLWTAQRNEKSDLLFLAAKEVLDRHKWKVSIALKRLTLLVAGILFLMVVFGKPFIGPGHIVSDFKSSIAGLMAFGLFAVGMSMHSKQVSYITLAARSKNQSFWQRNWEKVVMIFIGAVAGVSGKAFVDWLIHLFSSK